MWEGGLSNDLSEVLFSQEHLAKRVAELGSEITRDYAGKQPLMVGILTGASIFVCDLCRNINLPLKMDFMSVSSYGSGTESSGVVRILKDLNEPIEDRDIIIVEDIVDSGLTVKYLVENLLTRKPRSVEVCALLHKHRAEAKGLAVKYVGFECPNKFVVGYGLDYAGRYRNVPYIGVLKPEVYTKPAH